MSKAVEYRMKHGNPLDRLKRLVDAGEMTAEKELGQRRDVHSVYVSQKIPDWTTVYGPLQTPEPALPTPVEVVGKDYSHKPRVRIPVRGLAEPTRKPRRWTVKAAIGRKLIALGRYLVGDLTLEIGITDLHWWNIASRQFVYGYLVYEVGRSGQEVTCSWTVRQFVWAWAILATIAEMCPR
jgi:hypothetical protein